MGISVLVNDKNSKVTYCLENDEFLCESIEYYRITELPVNPNLILDNDKKKNKFLK